VKTLGDILALEPMRLHAHWNEIDRIVMKLPSYSDQICAWEQICDRLSSTAKGHPFFRLGELHLSIDHDEATGLGCLESAYQEDKAYAAQHGGQRAEDKAAYRLLSICKDFFAHLRQKKSSDWESTLLLPVNRSVLINVLFTTYNMSTPHSLDTPSATMPTFQSLITDTELRRFAIENYFCADRLLLQFTLSGGGLDKHSDKYPLGRAIIGLFGGTLEAIWLDKLPHSKRRTLDSLLKEAHQNHILKPSTRIASLSSLVCFLRNHIHPDRDVKRQDYFIDINVAKGCKAALNLAIGEMVHSQRTEADLSG
jgi:hypothetical protein